MNSYPVNGQVDVYINKPLTYTFDKAVDETSLYSGSVVLYDSKDHSTVDGVISYDAATFTVRFLPETALTPDTTYTWTFAGADDPDLFPLKFQDSSELAESIYIDFQTGVQVFTTEIQQQAGVDTGIGNGIIEDGQTVEEREEDTFKVTSTTPDHLESGVDVGLSQIVITFSSPVKAGLLPQDYVKVTYEAILRETYLYNNSNFNNTTQTEPGKTPEVTDFTMPALTMAFNVERTILTITKTDTDRKFNANAFIRVTIDKSLKDVNDVYINSKQDETFYFLTQIFPMFSTVQAVLLSLSEVPGLVSEEVVIRYILKNSFYIWQISGRSFSLTNPPPAAISYVECATILNLIDGKSILKEINRGKAMQLGDLKIDYNFPRNPESEILAIKAAAAQCMLIAKKEITSISGKHDFRIGERGSNARLVFDVYRNRINSGSGRVNNADPGRGF